MKEAVQRGRIIDTSEGKYYMKAPSSRSKRRSDPEVPVDEEGRPLGGERGHDEEAPILIFILFTSQSVGIRRRSSSKSKSQKSFENKMNRFSFLNKDYT